ncbi:MAG: NUDIX hydrolase, partial [Microthrixaceae bacterium]
APASQAIPLAARSCSCHDVAVHEVDPADELVDVVDEHDQVIDTVTRAEMRRRRLRHRCTYVVVRTSDGGVLVHRRSEDKDLWPGAWDLAVGGVVTSGEDWERAARRELAEEVGVADVELEPIGAGAYSDDHVDEVARMWTVTWDGPVTFADGEVVEAHVVTLDELRARLDRDRFVPDSRALLADHLLGE